MHSDRRRVICTLAVVSVAIIITWPAPVSADSQHDGPWFKAKVGTSIRYRITQPETMPGVPPKSAVITEEVVERHARDGHGKKHAHRGGRSRADQYRNAPAADFGPTVRPVLEEHRVRPQGCRHQGFGPDIQLPPV